MKIAIYPGSFNPWHEGHDDVLRKALLVFDKVVIAVGRNPDKAQRSLLDLHEIRKRATQNFDENYDVWRVEITEFDGLLADFANDYFDTQDGSFFHATAIVRGLRNGQDFEFEKAQQYWNEDLGLKIPIVYLVSNRELVHISSSAIRAIEKFKK